MSYAFTFKAWNKPADDDEDTPSRKDPIDVTVVGSSEDEALKEVQVLVTRDVYKLDQVVELTDLNSSHNSW